MRQRTSYPKPFKAQVVQECLSPDVSIASVALRHGINANLVRKWIPIYRDRQACALPAFVPLKLETAGFSGLHCSRHEKCQSSLWVASCIHLTLNSKNGFLEVPI